MNFKIKQSLACLLLLTLGASPYQAQDEDDSVPVPLPPTPFGQEDSEQGALQKELRELFLKVEKNLIQIDHQLADAGAGEVQLQEMPDAGLDDLLRSVQDKGNETKSQIDRILEIAKEMDQSGSGGGSGSSSKKPGSEPSPGSKPGGPQQEENTPEAEKPGEEEAEGAGQKKPETGPDGEPLDGGESEERGGQNFPGGAPQEGAKTRIQQNLEADKWGFLPERQQRTFRNQGRDNLPVQYRQWIDTYYRRLNKENK